MDEKINKPASIDASMGSGFICGLDLVVNEIQYVVLKGVAASNHCLEEFFQKIFLYVIRLLAL